MDYWIIVVVKGIVGQVFLYANLYFLCIDHLCQYRALIYNLCQVLGKYIAYKSLVSSGRLKYMQCLLVNRGHTHIHT